MGVCVVLNPDGTVTATADTLETCADHWLTSAAEVSQQLTLAEALAMPTPEEAAAVWASVVALIVGLYVIGRVVGSVANFFTR